MTAVWLLVAVRGPLSRLARAAAVAWGLVVCPAPRWREALRPAVVRRTLARTSLGRGSTTARSE